MTDTPAASVDRQKLRLPWHRETVGHLSTAGIAAKIAADLDFPLGEGLPPNTDATWIVNADNKVVAFVGNGPRQTHNADAIIAAVSAQPSRDREAVRLQGELDALQRMALLFRQGDDVPGATQQDRAGLQYASAYLGTEIVRVRDRLAAHPEAERGEERDDG